MLRECKFHNRNWHDLGLKLKLFPNTLDNIEANNPRDVSKCLRECLSSWLRGVDDAMSEPRTRTTLANAVEKTEQGRDAAEHIRYSKKLQIDVN